MLVLQTDTIDLTDEGSRSDRAGKTFQRSKVDRSADSLIDVDGLPYLGQVPFSFVLNFSFYSVINRSRLTKNVLTDHSSK